MKTNTIQHAAVGAALLLVSTAAVAHIHGTQEKMAWPPPRATSKISPVDAIQIATKKMGGGTAFCANFEFDEGHWVYGVMVVKGHKISEVEIDPITGKVGDTEQITPEGEAGETRSELTAIVKAGG